MIKNEIGITLVSLAIAIVVMTLMAGLIAYSVSDIGKVGEATNTVQDTYQSDKRKAESEVNKVNDEWGDVINKKGIDNETVVSMALNSGIKITDPGVKPASANATVVPLSTTETTDLKDNKDNIVKVPKNFGIAYDSGDNVAEGIVIEYTGTSDSDPLKGNQYVWVPVGQAITKTDGTTMPAITLGRYDFDAQWNSSTSTIDGTGAATIKQDSANWSTPTSFAPTGRTWNVYEYSADNSEGNAYGNTKANDLEGFITSANSNHGYYIARYEAGSGASNSKPYTQKDKTAWVSITQPNASTACQSMYSGLNTDLINSYAWDTAIVYIQTATGNTAYSKQNRGSNTSIVSTGMTGDEQCKINDMAKNIYEWTTESSTSTASGVSRPCVDRGGVYYNDVYFTALRHGYSTTNSYPYLGFRPLLYL